MKKSNAAIGPLLFAAVWSTGVLTVDGLTVRTTYLQIRSAGYPRVEGQITHSEVSVHRDDEGEKSYGVDVEFEYQVGGIAYQADRYRYGRVDSSDHTSQRIVDSLPVGHAVDVFYNPGDPADAVLVTGLEGRDLLMAMFLTPFNLAMIGLWGIVYHSIFSSRDEGASGGLRAVRRGSLTLVRMEANSPMLRALSTVFLLAFALTFVVVLSFGFDPPMPLMIGVWGFILAAGAVVLAWDRFQPRRLRGRRATRPLG